jgi:hypothetical protein
MISGTVAIHKDGTRMVAGSAIEAARGHALWCILRMWTSGFIGRRIRGLTEAIDLAGKMTGHEYRLSDLDRVTLEPEEWWKAVRSTAKIDRETA